MSPVDTRSGGGLETCEFNILQLVIGHDLFLVPFCLFFRV